MARFMHICGHMSTDMLYGSLKFAEADRPAQEARQCSACEMGITPEEFERRKQLSQLDPTRNLEPSK